MATRNITCACGAVQIELEGEPVFAGTCHCDDCQKATGAAFNQAAFWPIDKVTVKRGEELLKMWKVRTTPRYSCQTCSNMLYMAPQAQPLFGFNGSLLPDYKPLFHMQTKFGKVKVLDDTPKFAGLPPSFGGKPEMADWSVPSKRAVVARSFDKPADKVWALFTDWTSPHKFGSPITYEGPEGVGRIRTIKTPERTLRQQLLSRDDALKRISYTFIGGAANPDYLGTPLVLDVVPVGENSCCVTYTGLLSPKASAEQVEKVAAGLAGALDKAFAPDIAKL